MESQVVEKLPAGYLSYGETSPRLGSESTIARLVRDGRLRTQLVQRDGRKPERFYSAEDVERIEAERKARALRAAPTAIEARSSANPAALPEFLGLLRELVQARQLPAPPEVKEPAVPLNEKLWLSPAEARRYSGLSRQDLRDLVFDGILVARGKGRGVRILRKSLEAFEG